MAKYTSDQIALIIRGREHLAGQGHDMPLLNEEIVSLGGEGGYEALSEKHRYWIDRWLQVGLDVQQKEVREQAEYMAKPATVADIFAILGKDKQDMWGDDILIDTTGPKTRLGLALTSVHSLQEALIRKGLLTSEDIEQAGKDFRQEIKDRLDSLRGKPAQEERSDQAPNSS